MNTDNNLGMTGSSGANEAPMPDETSARRMAQDFEDADSVTVEELADLRTRAGKADENWEKYVRVTADLDNYKKRAARERSDAIRYANEGLLEKLLPIVDNFEAALAAAGANTGNMDSLRQGIQMIYTQLKGFLNDAGVEEIDALNKPFDPNLHEAVSQLATADVPEEQVVQQLRKGYKLRDRLVRPAMVVVAKKP